MTIDRRGIQQLCVVYIVTWMIAPPLAYDLIYRLLAVGAAGIWVLIQNMGYRSNDTDNDASKSLSTYLMCSVVFSAALLFFDLVYRDYSMGQAFYGNITTFVLLFIGYVAGAYCKELRYEELKKLLTIIIILVVVFSITSIYRSDEFYLATRSAGGEVSDEYNALARNAAMHGVGSFGFFAFSGAFAPLLLWHSYSQVGRKKVLCILCFFIVEAGVLSAGYTLAFLISAIGIVFTIVIKVKSVVLKLLLFFCGLCLLLFWNAFSVSLYSFFQNIASGTMYANKVEDIFSFLIGGNSVGTFESRQERYLLSLTSIFRYPILGSYILNGTNSIGYHSSILDPYASYGWVIGASWTYIIAFFPAKLSHISLDKKLGFLGWLVMFLTALFNRTTMIMGIFFLIMPAIAYSERLGYWCECEDDL